MYRTILVPLDGSPFAEFALPPALALARSLGAEVALLSVQDPVPTFAFGEWSDEPETWRSEYVDDIAGRVAEGTGIEPSTSLRVGRAEDEILAQVEEEGIDLVVMASHGRGPLSRFWLGSVADAVVRRASPPVLLVRPEEDEEPDLADRGLFQKILVPLDGSPEAEEVLNDAVQFAKIADGALELLQVVHYPTEIASAYPPDTMRINEEMVEEGQQRAKNYLTEVARSLTEHGVEASTRVRVEVHPATGIVRTAEEDGADLVAMTTHGRGGLKRTFLGSVTDKAIRSLHLPVLTVRPPGSDVEDDDR